MTSNEQCPANASAHESSNQEGDIGFLDIALVLAENLRLLILGPLAVGLAALGCSYLITPTYTARAVLLPPQQQQSSAAAALQSLGALAGLAGGAAGIKSPADQYVALMQTTTVEDRLIEKFKLMTVYEVDFKTDARRQLEARTRISAGKKDGLITIEVDDHDPGRAADIANAYIEELRHLTSLLAMTEAQQRRLFFEKQLAQTKERFTVAQRALQSAGINEGSIRAEPKAAAEAYAKLRAETTAAEIRLQSMRGYLAEGAPEFRQAQLQLGALRAQLSRAEGSNPAVAGGDYIDKFREFKYQETLFELFAKQFELARVDESREGTLIQAVDSATPPERKSKPKKAIIAVASSLASVVALLLLIFIKRALLRQRLDPVSSKKLKQLTTLIRRIDR
jgi:uncharacterized protein involved in exopolysaccharide biosynthesis